MPLNLERVDPPPIDSLDFFLRDFLGMSGRFLEDKPLDPWPTSWCCRLDITLPSDESLECRRDLPLDDESFFFGESDEPSFEEWRLEDFGTSDRSLPEEFSFLLPSESTKPKVTCAVSDSTAKKLSIFTNKFCKNRLDQTFRNPFNFRILSRVSRGT